jgi:hypothetical protein
MNIWSLFACSARLNLLCEKRCDDFALLGVTSAQELVGPGRLRRSNEVNSGLLQNLMAGTESTSQFIGGLVVAVLYVVIGLLSAIGSIFAFRRIFQRRWEQIFWASWLVLIAAFYLSFAAYFGASTHAWHTEVVAVVIFLVCAVTGLFFRSAIAVGYVLHGLWDLSHCLSGSSLAGLSITEIPLGYALFCSTYDFVVAYYLLISDSAWHASGRFDPYFWRIK